MAPPFSIIRLIGPGGAAKSTGGALARRLACPFHDLNREFERRRGHIDAIIDVHRYEAYARENVAVYLELLPHLTDSVLALSSGFLVYPISVHPTYPVVVEAVVASPITVVLLPSLERHTCIAETARRQLGRPICRRRAARDEAVIRARYVNYLSLPVVKVETMRTCVRGRRGDPCEARVACRGRTPDGLAHEPRADRAI